MPRSDTALIGWAEHVADEMVRAAGEQSDANGERVNLLLREQPAVLQELSRYFGVLTSSGLGVELGNAGRTLSPAACEVLKLARVGLAPA